MILGAVIGMVALGALALGVTIALGHEFRPHTYSWFLWTGVGALIGYFFN